MFRSARVILPFVSALFVRVLCSLRLMAVEPPWGWRHLAEVSGVFVPLAVFVVLRKCEKVETSYTTWSLPLLAVILNT